MRRCGYADMLQWTGTIAIVCGVPNAKCGTDCHGVALVDVFKGANPSTISALRAATIEICTDNATAVRTAVAFRDESELLDRSCYRGISPFSLAEDANAVRCWTRTGIR
jgi:hypothetical protein